MSLITDAKKLINGLMSPETDLSVRRQAICARCPLLRRGAVDTCGDCGCVIVAKTRLPQESCPQGKW